MIPAEPRPASSILIKVTAAAAYLFVGGLAGWWLNDIAGTAPNSIADLPERAVSAHAVYTPEVRHPVEVTADQQTHLVKWLTKRLGVTVRAPVLSTAGYELVGGRLLPGVSGPAAHFMYQEASGERLTLYVRDAKSDSGETAFRYSHEEGIGVFILGRRGCGVRTRRSNGKGLIARRCQPDLPAAQSVTKSPGTPH